MLQPSIPRSVWVLLALTLAASAAGRLMIFELDQGSALFSWLWLDLDLGEGRSFDLCRAGAVAALAAALLGVHPHFRLLWLWSGLWGALGALGELTQTERHPWLVPISHAARYLPALAVAALLLAPRDRRAGGLNLALRAGLALTFGGHGYQALTLEPAFVDFLLLAHRKLLGGALEQGLAERLLVVIGGADLACAGAVLFLRWRALWAWMAFWGALTAGARIVHAGVENGLPETLLRAPHAFLPLILWRLEAARGRGENP